jgi:hypothetical protein
VPLPPSNALAAAFDAALYDASRFGLSDPVGGFLLPHGRFSPADAAEVAQAIDAEIDRLHCEGDLRGRAERAAEALVSICHQDNRRQINAGRNFPHIVVGAELSVLTGEQVGPVHTNVGIGLSRDALHRLACEAVLHIVTTDAARRPLDLHRSARVFSRAQRRAMAHRDGPACCFPGAGDPPRVLPRR